MNRIVTTAGTAGIPVVNVDTHVADQTNVISFITGDRADDGVSPRPENRETQIWELRWHPPTGRVRV